jgi:hypothetical protein
MSLYLRKRKRVGPLSPNVSKRGLGLTGGLARRARFSVGPSTPRFSFRLARGLNFRRKL